MDIRKLPLPVTLIVDPAYGDGIARHLSSDVWLVGTPTNKAAVDVHRKRLSKADRQKLTGSLTTFDADGETPEDWAISIIETIDSHHGLYAQDPPYESLRVIGVGASEAISRIIFEMGLPTIEVLPDGFLATK